MARAAVFVGLLWTILTCYASQPLSSPPVPPFLAYLTCSEHAARGVLCSASIVHESFVLTAASCFYTTTGEPISYHHQVLIADEYKEISQLIPHPRYRLQSGSYDVGLVKLARRLRLGGRALLARGELLEMADTTCWDMSGKKAVSKVQPTVVVPRTQCSTTLFGRYTTASMLCARLVHTNTTCSVDSGAPLFKGEQLFAVAARAHPPRVVYTNLHTVRWWVVSTITGGNLSDLFTNYMFL